MPTIPIIARHNMILLKDNTNLVGHLPHQHQRLLIMGIGLLILILGIGHPAYTDQGIPDIVTRKLGTEVRPVYTIPHIDPTIPTDTGIISKLIIFCQEIVRLY